MSQLPLCSPVPVIQFEKEVPPTSTCNSVFHLLRNVTVTATALTVMIPLGTSKC